MNRLERKLHLTVIFVLATGPCVVAQTNPVAVIRAPVPADAGSAAFSHDGKLVATMGELGRYTTLWDAKTGQKVAKLSSGWAPIITPSGSISTSSGATRLTWYPRRGPTWTAFAGTSK